MAKMGYAMYSSPNGPIYVIGDETGIKRVEIFEEEWQTFSLQHPDLEEGNELCLEAVKQLDEYFNGKRKTFDLPLSVEGTEFRKKVWKALQEIPYGEVRSYSDIAETVGSPKAVRAVGQANKANQVPIIIPCHRVIGKSGDMTGYAGSRIPMKIFLLETEGYKQI